MSRVGVARGIVVVVTAWLAYQQPSCGVHTRTHTHSNALHKPFVKGVTSVILEVMETISGDAPIAPAAEELLRLLICCSLWIGSSPSAVIHPEQRKKPQCPHYPSRVSCTFCTECICIINHQDSSTRGLTRRAVSYCSLFNCAITMRLTHTITL